ncbi:TlpA disulfide reductase family protein [Cytobacillus gottheilii]|uniref:TlpA disulfide reductase family protein n=1 Tax=Cytobacillus gottheilii TaxID=859144 RepID=UPI002494CEAE|nr:TlpA disulfide reductase family protein [Cytobacillus gottheilii]
MPGWQDFYERHRNQDFELLSVSVDIQGAEAVKPYVKNTSFQTVIDADNSLANHLGFNMVPNGIFIDKNGTIRLIKQKFYVSDTEHLEAVEKLISGTVEKVVLEDQHHYAQGKSDNLEKQLAETKFKLGMHYTSIGKKEEALKELDEALLLDTDNFLIRKQRWYIRHPEKFSPNIDTEWQQNQLKKEKAEEAILKENQSCGLEGCSIPSRPMNHE